MTILFSFLLLAAGLAMLLFGGDLLVRGASALARVLGISELVIGLTVVAFGTSAPELAVNVLAAWEDRGEISFGNIIGSNIANIGLILGISAMIRPLAIQGQVIRRELPMMLLATVATVIMALDLALRDQAGAFDRSDGLIMLLLFGVFLYYTVAQVLVDRQPDAINVESSEFLARVAPDGGRASLPRSAFLTVAGLTLLVIGGRVTVDQASALALAFGVPEVIVGLTLVALGTSLPELVTSIFAVCRGQSDLAIGNVIGSNIFNLLFILGTTAALRPIPVPEGGFFDLNWMTGLSLILVPMVLTTNRRIMRHEGLILLGAYFVFVIWRIAQVLTAS